MITVSLTPWKGYGYKTLGVHSHPSGYCSSDVYEILVGGFAPSAGFLEHPIDEIIGPLQDHLRWS